MKLVVFTPVVRRSAIGWCSASVVGELTRMGHDVRVVRTESSARGADQLHDFSVDILSWRDERSVRQAVEAADAIFYQIGNNFEFHGGALEWIGSHPGIVALHDFFLGHLFWGWSEGRRESGTAHLRAWYGDEVADAYFRIEGSERFIDATIDIAPMTEWVSAMARGVITHSSWGADRVLRSCPGPVRVVALPYDKPVHAGASERGSADTERFEVLTIGHVNSNKRVDSVIAAIAGSSALRAHMVYRLAGSVHPDTRSRLEALAHDNGVHLDVLGEVDDEVLARVVASADVVACLRWPCLESASASLIESLLWGKPTIVTDAGFYRDIPANCVVKVRHDQEIDDLRAALERLYASPAQRTELARSGREWAASTFTTRGYARELIDMATDVARAEPIRRAVASYAGILHRWHPNGMPPGVEDVAEPIGLLDSASHV